MVVQLIKVFPIVILTSCTTIETPSAEYAAESQVDPDMRLLISFDDMVSGKELDLAYTQFSIGLLGVNVGKRSKTGISMTSAGIPTDGAQGTVLRLLTPLYEVTDTAICRVAQMNVGERGTRDPGGSLEPSPCLSLIQKDPSSKL